MNNPYRSHNPAITSFLGMALVLGGVGLFDHMRLPGERKMFPTLKGVPEWKKHGRHQGAKEKARRLRQIKKGQEGE